MSQPPAAYDQQVSQSGRRGPGGWKFYPIASTSAAASQSSQTSLCKTGRKQARPRCIQCGSRRFRRDPNTGLVVCREGHILQGYREEEVHDDQDFVVLGQRREVRKGGRNRKLREQRDVWVGPRATFLGLECLQLVLRLQLKALRLEWPHLPPEVDAIARDLWTLHVSSFRDLAATPYNENFDFVVDRLRTARKEYRFCRSYSRSRSRSRMLEVQEHLKELNEQQKAEEDQNAQEEKRLEAELKCLSGGQGNDLSATTMDDQPSPIPFRPTTLHVPRRRKAFSPMITCVAILYLALCTARVPVMWSDLQTLMAAGRLPFLSVLQLLPFAMTAKLSSAEATKLEEDAVPSPQALQECTHQLADHLHRRFKVKFPELNMAPVLWRCVQALGLPPTFYQAALAVLDYLGIPLTAVSPRAISDPWSVLGCSDGDLDSHDALPTLTARTGLRQGSPFASRCAIVVAAIVVAAKMEFGLDGKDRGYHLLDPPGKHYAVPPADKWLAALNASRTDRREHPAFSFELNRHPGDLSAAAIDRLLDHSEETYLQRTQPNIRHRQRKSNLQNIFDALPPPVVPGVLPPFDIRPAADRRQSLLSVQAELRDRLNSRIYPLSDTSAMDNTNLRPGEDYPIYTSEAISAGLIPSSFQLVLECAAELVGLNHGDGGGWLEMAETVSDLERLLLRRLRQDVQENRCAGRDAASKESPHEERTSDDVT